MIIQDSKLPLQQSPGTDSQLMPWDFLKKLDNFSNRCDELSKIYQTNAPFPHIILDDFLDPIFLEIISQAFPKPNEEFWVRTHISNEIKSATATETFFPTPIRSCLYAMNSGPMLHFLEKLTGINGLIPDPFFAGGGLHQTLPGGKLGVHIDFSQKPETKTFRRLNLLLYLNQDWNESYGGDLELWDSKGNHCEKKVAPQANRCVIFNTTSESFHGHPTPLACPPDRARNSLALYYYTAIPAERKKSFIHGTVFMDTSVSRNQLSKRVRRAFGLCCPPILLNGIKFCAAQLGFSR